MGLWVLTCESVSITDADVNIHIHIGVNWSGHNILFELESMCIVYAVWEKKAEKNFSERLHFIEMKVN